MVMFKMTRNVLVLTVAFLCIGILSGRVRKRKHGSSTKRGFLGLYGNNKLLAQRDTPDAVVNKPFAQSSSKPTAGIPRPNAKQEQSASSSKTDETLQEPLHDPSQPSITISKQSPTLQQTLASGAFNIPMASNPFSPLTYNVDPSNMQCRNGHIEITVRIPCGVLNDDKPVRQYSPTGSENKAMPIHAPRA